ncbi:hypothetical protein [Salinicola corii]|nr:hypothetical protein [Salinicola corii]
MIGGSIDIAMLGQATADAGQAIQFSGIAMYAAKRAGRNSWRFYEAASLA